MYYFPCFNILRYFGLVSLTKSERPAQWSALKFVIVMWQNDLQGALYPFLPQIAAPICFLWLWAAAAAGSISRLSWLLQEVALNAKQTVNAFMAFHRLSGFCLAAQ